MRARLFESSKRFHELPLLIGATGTSKGWMWLDKTPVYDGEWFNGDQDTVTAGRKNYMLWDHGFWRGIDGASHVPLMLIKYNKKRPQKVDYNTRSPLILKKFQIGSKKYWLLNATVDWYTAKRLTEMLGGRLAVADSVEELRQLKAATEKFSHLRLAIGAQRQCGKWVWLNNREVDVESIESQRTRSLNENYVCLYNQKVSACELLDGLLCEF